jgi:lipase ATG15
MSIQRLADRRPERIDALLDAGRSRGSPVALDASAWTIDEIPGPNVTDKDTVLSFARIASDAYILDDSDTEWQDVGQGFNYTEDFGWDNDGLRGHIFADTENKTVVVGIKGTSPAVFDGSETTTNDKINDNLFFSCCCGQGGHYSWKTVCECQTSAYTCNSTCVVEALRNKNRYYYAAQEIYRNVTELYPDADIWLAGHSLGGATSSLVALTYGIPVLTFEAPGDAMAASRLGLPTPPGYGLGFHQQRAMTGGYQFGHTADPIFMGTCNTISSVCSIAGYAMQSVCHTGLTCSYDTVVDFGWRSGVGNHRIKVVLKDVLEKYDFPAECKPMTNCTDCFNWEYFESHHSKPSTTTTTSTKTSTTTTRTSTCKTPGWWGCLDETTTTSAATTTTTADEEPTPTTSCKSSGWFGCKDPITTTEKSSTSHTASPTQGLPHPTTTPSSSSTSSCKTPGWFGCKDPTSTAAATATSTSAIATPTLSKTKKHSHKAQPTPTSSCAHRAWYGRCSEWTTVPHEVATGFEL